MTRPLKPAKEFYTEHEAASYLDISIDQLHALLDHHIFTDGNPRPDDLTFCESDLILLGFWNQNQDAGPSKVISMPRRPGP